LSNQIRSQIAHNATLERRNRIWVTCNRTSTPDTNHIRRFNLHICLSFEHWSHSDDQVELAA
jgi:hypothetical protein